MLGVVLPVKTLCQVASYVLLLQCVWNVKMAIMKMLVLVNLVLTQCHSV